MVPQGWAGATLSWGAVSWHMYYGGPRCVWTLDGRRGFEGIARGITWEVRLVRKCKAAYAILGHYRHASLFEFCLRPPSVSGHELDMFTLIATMLLLRISVDPIDHL
ncbi:hypothetical protein HBI70_188650 [Parastagonospora nodorum]|nr:hypothetical protein HBH52_198980 [Parastagonospora nodorum]KAH4183782.1 hypothetical protein HBH42_199070 [Parastagonospora nodorum]KAH5255572.1 hypothetical protein HBI70_188650 [Parastagonospora nodorum]KAH5303473.1 hypothetical protein HBI12_180470 [Parastagonospora nodorum]KAH6363195.1 hypothetical protein HBI34_175220 [Parastagonospora nodorum]